MGAGATIGMGANFSHYLVTVNGTQHTTTDEALIVTDPTGAVTITVSQVNKITGAGESATVTL